MKWTKSQYGTARIIIVLIIGILLFAQFPAAVERYYATGFYPYFGKYYRLLTGWCPFSIGDLLYLGAIIYAIFIFSKIVYVGFKHRQWPSLQKVLLKIGRVHV